MNYRIKTLLLLTALCAVVAYWMRPGWDAKSEPLATAPDEVQRIVEKHQLKFDLRWASMGEWRTDGGAYWRVPYSAEVLQDHLAEFTLVPTAPDADNRDVMAHQYPEDWPAISTTSVEWYAGRYNEKHDTNFGRWYVVVADRQAGMIYGYWTFWDFTP